VPVVPQVGLEELLGLVGEVEERSGRPEVVEVEQHLGQPVEVAEEGESDHPASKPSN